MRFAKILGTSVSALAVIVACNASDERAEDDRGPGRTNELLLTEAGLGPARFCMPLGEAAAALGPARDTVIESEEVRWPARVVALSDGGHVLLESSWSDSTHLWRVSTTSPSARTRAGTRVGMRLSELPAGSGPLSVEFPEGYLVVDLGADSVAAQLDTATERAVYSDPQVDSHALARIPRTARIRELISAGGCQYPDSAA